MYKNEITEIFAGVAFCQNLIVSDQVSEAAANFGKTNSSHSFSMADEVKLLTRKNRDFSDVNALGYTDRKDYKKKKRNDNCFLCGSDKHWAKDCALSKYKDKKDEVSFIKVKKSPAEWRNEKKRKRAKERVNNLNLEVVPVGTG